MKNLRLMLTALFAAFSLTCMSQERITLSMLKGTKWKVQGSTSRDTDEYTGTKHIWWREDGTHFGYPYYLSDTFVPSDTFDYSKVGKATSGCYLVRRNEKIGFTYCCSIHAFDLKKGIMTLELKTPDVLGGGTSTYILIR